MLQERLENEKSTPKSDLLLVVLLVLLAVFARVIMTAVRALPYGTTLQLLVLAGLCYTAYLVYAKRLIGYRYTLTFEQPAPDDLDAFGERRQHPYPLGSLVVERMVGDKGKVYELVMPQEYVALIPPGEASSIGVIGGTGKPKYSTLTIRPARTAHMLVFEREGKAYCMRFSPSPAFAQALADVIRDLRA